MLGKQWLSRYDSIDLRGSAIERSQDRQRKLNGINSWYFDQVIESLPLMLQAALLLLGCALSKYLWEINTTVAAVVVGVTSFGVLFYLFILVAGMASLDCPYQTPLSNLIRRSFRWACNLFIRRATLYSVYSVWCGGCCGVSGWGTVCCALLLPPVLLIALTIDVLQPPFHILVKLARSVYAWYGSPVPGQVLDSWVTELDFHCVSWILRTSSDITIKELAIDFLKTILLPSTLNSSTNATILANSFNIFSSCFVVGNADRIFANGLEHLAGTSAMCVLLTYSSVLTTEPSSAAIGNVRHQYERVFANSKMASRPLPVLVRVVHALLDWNWNSMTIDWRRHNPPVDELIPFSRALSQVAQSHYKTHHSSVPAWMIKFVFRFLSQKPLPPTSVVVDCLTLIAIELECEISDVNGMEFTERCVVS